MAALYCVGKEGLMYRPSSIIPCQIRINLVGSVDQNNERKRSDVMIRACLNVVAWLNSNEINHYLSALPKTSQQGTGSNEAMTYVRTARP